MAKFRYRMQNILDIKLKLESQAEIAYSAANAEYQEQQEILQKLLIRRNGYERRLRELMEGELDVAEVKHAKADVEAVREMVNRQMIQVQKAQQKVNAARAELNQVMMERKTQEKLRENAFEDFKKELADAENKEIDELVSYTFNH